MLPSVNNIIATTSFARSSSLTRILKAPHLHPNTSLPQLRSNPAADSNSHHQNLPYLDAPPVRLVNNKMKNRISKRSRTEALWTGRYRPHHRTSPPQAPEHLPRSGAMPVMIPEMPLTRPGRGGGSPDARVKVALRPKTRAVRRNTQTRSWNTLSRTPTRSPLCLSHLPKTLIRTWPLTMMVTPLFTGLRLWDGSG